MPDDDLPALLGDLGGHDLVELSAPSSAADAERDRPTVIFAYTIKGWRLPFAGDASTTPRMLLPDQVDQLGTRRSASTRTTSGPGSRRTRPKAAALGPEADRARLRRAAPTDLAGERPRDRRAGRPDRRGDQHPAGVRRHPRGAGTRPRDRRADRDGGARRRGLDEPRRLDQPGRRLLDGRGPGSTRRQAAAGLGAGSGRPPHRARHQRDEPVHVAQPVRADRRAVRRAAGAHRLGLRPVHLPRARCADLRALRQVALRAGRHAVGRHALRRRAAPTSRP